MSTGGNSRPEAERFEALLAPVLDRAFGLAYHLARGRDEAEDLVQEAALQAFSHFDQFQPGKLGRISAPPDLLEKIRRRLSGARGPGAGG